MKVTISKSGEITADVVSDSDIAMLRKLASFNGISYEQAKAPVPVLFQTPIDPNDIMTRLDLSRIPLKFRFHHIYEQLFNKHSKNIAKEHYEAYQQIKKMLDVLEQQGKVKKLKAFGRFYANLTLAPKPVSIVQQSDERPVIIQNNKRLYKPNEAFAGYQEFTDKILPKLPESFGMKDAYIKVYGYPYIFKHRKDNADDIQANRNYASLYATMTRCVRKNILSTRNIFLPTTNNRKIKHIIYTKIHAERPVEAPTPSPKPYTTERPSEGLPYVPEASIPEHGEDITYADIPVIDTKVIKSILDTYDSIDAAAFKGFRTKNGTPADSSSAQYAFQWIADHLSAVNRLTGRNFAIRGAGGYRYLEALK